MDPTRNEEDISHTVISAGYHAVTPMYSYVSPWPWLDSTGRLWLGARPSWRPSWRLLLVPIVEDMHMLRRDASAEAGQCM